MAATVLLGTVMAGMITAKARFSRQLVKADRRIEAVQAADHLLEQWWITGGVEAMQLPGVESDEQAIENAVRFDDLMASGDLSADDTPPLPPAMPRNGSGVVPDYDHWVWQTHEISGGDTRELNLNVIRLELYDQRDKLKTEPTLTVDIVAPAAEEDETSLDYDEENFDL